MDVKFRTKEGPEVVRLLQALAKRHGPITKASGDLDALNDLQIVWVMVNKLEVTHGIRPINPIIVPELPKAGDAPPTKKAGDAPPKKVSGGADKSKMVNVTGTIRHFTDRAVLVDVMGAEEWFPLSKITLVVDFDKIGEEVTFTAPLWILEDKGL